MGQLNLSSGVEFTGSGNYFSHTGTTSPILLATAPETSQSISDATWTKNTWITGEKIDSDSAYTSTKFTVPAGKAGWYYVAVGVNLYSDGNNMRTGQVAIYKNGSRVAGSYSIVMSGDQDLRHFQCFNQTVLELAVNDYIEQYMYCDCTSGSIYMSSDASGIRGNYLLIYKL